LAERLEAAVGGSPFAGAVALQFSALKTVTPGPETLVGRTLERVTRRGEFVVMEFGGPRLLCHLSQGGRAARQDPTKATQPTRAALSDEERRRVLDGTHEVLDEALASERQRTGGLQTKIGDHFAVHGRYGYPCPRCGGDLRRVSYESHEVAYCPACQTGGKILADRRMSRLVR